jgi:Raf kinase inhibitor-like YbhB/YbcL family protein
MAFKLRSPAFGPGGEIPLEYTGAGADISPPLRWTGPPEGTKSFALTVDDRDDRSGIWVHWALYGISGTIRELPEGVPRQDTVSGVGTQGLTDFGGVGDSGPRPPISTSSGPTPWTRPSPCHPTDSRRSS